ncbi:MAG: hypothetical protein GY864_12885, partial [Desulfobacterales bacterium]|nr:hypothetical protein [Desulfobacterales bacterium]
EKEKKPEEEVDFAALANSLGVQARYIHEPEEEITEKEIKAAFSSKTGMLFDAS